MFNFLLGLLIGFFGSMMLISCLSAFEIKIDMSVITNIFIASATVVATIIHFDSQRKHRSDRVWDINKAVLLDLVQSLSEVIEATENQLQNCQSHLDEIGVNREVWKDLEEKISYVLSVYRPLMNKGLISSIESHVSINQTTTDAVNYQGLDHNDAYATMLAEHKKLYSELQEFISQLSGVQSV